MSQKAEIWHFIAWRLANREPMILLVVAESHGSSPGRAGYKMAVAADGEMRGSIGGGVMEVRLVERAKSQFRRLAGFAPTLARSLCQNSESKISAEIIDQVHRPGSADASGMICSGRQTVIALSLKGSDLKTVKKIIDAVDSRAELQLSITAGGISIGPPEGGTQNSITFERLDGDDFIYRESLTRTNHLFIVGGGHCSLALSEMMSRLDFRVSVFDDRPDINTLEANDFADEIAIIDDYANIAKAIPNGDNIYVAVMTIGYEYDAVVIRQLLDHDLKYFGVLGSRAKMATLMKQLKAEGHSSEKLSRIRTPIGLSIRSRTPEEIAVSIAAEIISVKNS